MTRLAYLTRNSESLPARSLHEEGPERTCRRAPWRILSPLEVESCLPCADRSGREEVTGSVTP
jgi:hypothetical protein